MTPTATVSYSATEQLLEPQLVNWRQKPLDDHEQEGAPAERGLALVSYAPPRLLPLQPDIETSERPREFLTALQSWEGVVLDVDESSFLARLIDATGENVDEEVTLAREELSDFDRELLEPGAIFYWTIGYRQKLRGARERVSRIRFRRLPAWTPQQLDEAQERAAQLACDLDW